MYVGSGVEVVNAKRELSNVHYTMTFQDSEMNLPFGRVPHQKKHICSSLFLETEGTTFPLTLKATFTPGKVCLLNGIKELLKENISDINSFSIRERVVEQGV